MFVSVKSISHRSWFAAAAAATATGTVASAVLFESPLEWNKRVTHCCVARAQSQKESNPPTPLACCSKHTDTGDNNSRVKNSNYGDFMAPVDAIVLGAGVVGLSVANELASKYNARVIVIEKEDVVAAGVSASNSGLGCTGYDAPVGSLERRLLRRSIRIHQNLYRSFGLSHEHVNKCGSIVVAWTPEELKKLKNVVDENIEAGDDDVELLNQAELRELEPALSHAALGGVFLPREAVVEPWLVPMGYALNALRNGAQIHTGEKVVGVEFTPHTCENCNHGSINNINNNIINNNNNKMKDNSSSTSIGSGGGSDFDIKSSSICDSICPITTSPSTLIGSPLDCNRHAAASAASDSSASSSSSCGGGGGVWTVYTEACDDATVGRSATGQLFVQPALKENKTRLRTSKYNNDSRVEATTTTTTTVLRDGGYRCYRAKMVINCTGLFGDYVEQLRLQSVDKTFEEQQYQHDDDGHHQQQQQPLTHTVVGNGASASAAAAAAARYDSSSGSSSSSWRPQDQQEDLSLLPSGHFKITPRKGQFLVYAPILPRLIAAAAKAEEGRGGEPDTAEREELIIHAANASVEKNNNNNNNNSSNNHQKYQHKPQQEQEQEELSHIIEPVATEFTKGVIVWKTVYGNIIVGPTAVDQESKTDRTTDEGTISQLKAFGERVLPALKEEAGRYKVVGTYSGLRPSTQYRDYQIYTEEEYNYNNNKQRNCDCNDSSNINNNNNCRALSHSSRPWITVGGIRSTGLSASSGIGEYVGHLYAAIAVDASEKERERGGERGRGREGIKTTHIGQSRHGSARINCTSSNLNSMLAPDGLLGVTQSALNPLSTPSTPPSTSSSASSASDDQNPARFPTLRELAASYQQNNDGTVYLPVPVPVSLSSTGTSGTRGQIGIRVRVTHPISSFGMETLKTKK